MNEYFGVIDDDQVENTWNIEAMELSLIHI